MKILIVRHAPAGDKKRWAKAGRPDALRPLTREGKARMRRAAKGLASVEGRPQLIATSPFLRARQTAEIVGEAYGKPRLAELRELVPGADPASLRVWLKGRREGRIALVGHEPHLGKAIALLCSGRPEPVTELKKGQACLLDFDGRKAALLWSLRPAQLRKLGRA